MALRSTHGGWWQDAEGFGLRVADDIGQYRSTYTGAQSGNVSGVLQIHVKQFGLGCYRMTTMFIYMCNSAPSPF